MPSTAHQARREAEVGQTGVQASKAFVQAKERRSNRPRVELRNTKEVVERVSLQTLNKQFAKRLLAQRQKMKMLEATLENSTLDYKMLVQQDEEADRKWGAESLDTHCVRWEANDTTPLKHCQAAASASHAAAAYRQRQGR